MELYIIKSVACLGVLFLFYKLALENTSLHTIKRFFLLGSLVISLVIPCITFTEYIEVTPVLTETFTQIPITILEPTETITAPINYLPYFLGGIYSLGVLIFSIRFGRNMFRIFTKVRNNPKFKKQSIFHVLLKLPVTPHSFFHYIFFSKTAYETGEVPQEVIAHETAHVEQKHSWDIVFFELLRIVFWFNPLLYFIKHSIKLNHEFLADRTVLNEGADLSRYQTILLDFSSPDSYRDPSLINLAHSINYSSIKKRFTVMKTHTSKRAAWVKGLLILPLLAVLIYGFSTTQVFEKVSETLTISEDINIIIDDTGGLFVNGNLIDFDELPATLLKYNEHLTQEERSQNVVAHIYAEENILMEHVFNVNDKLRDYGIHKVINHPTASEVSGEWRENTIQKFSKEKATERQLALYNKLAKKHNAVPITERKIGWEDLKSLENIYRLMDATQKENAQPFPECLPKNQTSWEQGYAKEYNDGATRNNKKSIVITINVSEIMVNGKATSLKNFAKEVDKATKDWTTADFQAAHPSVMVAATPDSFMEKVATQFQKTNYFKKSGENIIPTSPPPPPPAPDALRVIKGINDTDGNIPPPPPPAPNVIKGVNDGNLNIPPPPPPPMNSMDHVIDMAKKNATFYFEGKKITSDKAIELIKKNKDLNIQTTGSSSKNPQVKISTKPITFNPNKKTGAVKTIPKHFEKTLIMTLVDPPNFGPQTDSEDPKVVLDLMLKNNAPLFYSSNMILDKRGALTLIKAHASVEIVTLETVHDVTSVIFSLSKDD